MSRSIRWSGSYFCAKISTARFVKRRGINADVEDGVTESTTYIQSVGRGLAAVIEASIKSIMHSESIRIESAVSVDRERIMNET